jgi:hypothetical protein
MTAMVTILRPIPITDAVLKSTTATETVPLYVATATYAVGAMCRSDVTHRIYESAAAGNIGHDPAVAANLSGTTPYWVEVGSSNVWAMFDNDMGSQTVANSPFTFVAQPGFFSTAEWFGLDADEIHVVVRDKPGGAIVKEVAHVLEGSAPADYDEYFWDPFKPETDFTLTDVEQYFKAEITVTLTKASGPVRCAAFVVGDEIVLGKTLSQPKVSPLSYATIEANRFGITTIVDRRNTTDLQMTALLDVSEAEMVRKTLQQHLGTPCVWKGSSSIEYGGLRQLGLGSGDIVYDVAPGKCQLSLNVQGIIQWQL